MIKSSLNWTRIVTNFEAKFNIAFTVDKKAYFDNLPDEYKVIDGARGVWSKLILLDAVIYILVNDSFNSSNRRTFNQHKVLCDCVLDELKTIDPQAHAELMAEKNTSSLTSNYLAIPAFSRELAQKFQYLAAHEQLVYPWNSIGNLRSSHLAAGAKTKSKFNRISELLTSHGVLSQYEYNLDVIINLVICRALFVFKNHKVMMVPMMSLCELSTDGSTVSSSLTSSLLSSTAEIIHSRKAHMNKRSATPTDVMSRKKISSDSSDPQSNTATVCESKSPLSTSSDSTSNSNSDRGSDTVSVSSVVSTVYQASIPMQVASELISDDFSNIMDFDFDSDDGKKDQGGDEAEKVRKNANWAKEKLKKLKDKMALRKALKAQKTAQTHVTMVIQKTEDERMHAIIPVLPLKMLEHDSDDSMQEDGDGDGGARFDTNDFNFFNDTSRDGNSDLISGGLSLVDPSRREYCEDGVSQGGSLDGGGISDQDSEGDKTYRSCISSLTTDTMKAVSGERRQDHILTPAQHTVTPKQGPGSTIYVAIDPAATTYVLIDNVLCAIIPVENPELFLAAARAGALNPQTSGAGCGSASDGGANYNPNSRSASSSQCSSDVSSSCMRTQERDEGNTTSESDTSVRSPVTPFNPAWRH